jgi:flagellar assembly protein FliH
MAELREAAAIQGHAAGHAAGFAAGRAEGLAAAAAEVEHLRRLCKSVAAALDEFNGETAEALLGLAMDTARHVLRTELQSHPETMLAGLHEAIDLAGTGAQPHLLLNPGDIGFVKRHLGEELTATGWRLTEDARIEPGGCRVVTGNGTVDATLSTRWQRTLATLGRNDPLERAPAAQTAPAETIDAIAVDEPAETIEIAESAGITDVAAIDQTEAL